MPEKNINQETEQKKKKKNSLFEKMGKNKIVSKTIRGELNLTRFNVFLFAIIGIMIVVFIFIIPTFKEEQVVYRNTKSNAYLSKVQEEKLNDIYRETNPVLRYKKIEDFKTQMIDSKGTIDDEIFKIENNIIDEAVTKINTVEELASTNPIKYFPEIEDLIKTYQKMPSLYIGEELNNAIDVYTNALKSGERELIEEYKSKHYWFNPNFDISGVNAEILQNIGNRLIKYLQIRIDIAKNIEEVKWAYSITKDSINLYNDVKFNKLPLMEEKISLIKSKVYKLNEKYGQINQIIEDKKIEATNIYYSDEYDLDTKSVLLNGLLIDAQSIEKNLGLIRKITEFQMYIADKLFEELKSGIKKVVQTYEKLKKYHNILNHDTVPKMISLLESYLEKDIVKKYPYSSNLMRIKEAIDYLKIVFKYNVNFVVTLNEIRTSANLDGLSLVIGTYSNDKSYDSQPISVAYRTKSVEPKRENEFSSYIYSFEEEIIFPFDLESQIIIRFRSDNKYILSLSSNERADFPTRFVLPNEKGNHFLIFEQKDILFNLNGQNYKIEMDFNTNELPNYPIFFVELFS